MSEPTTGMMVTSNVRLLRPLGEGGMGSVWVAEHLSLRTQVVVKFMAAELAGSEEALARFSREAASASQVKSPHVVQTFDHGVTEGGTPYIVMELLEGRDLEQQIRAGRLEPGEVVAVVAQLARALGKAHERGIMHRDIKPSNVFLCDAGSGELFVKLLDFGIAKGQGADGGLGVIGSTTRTGAFIGSPFYMSPEQVIGAKTIDFKTDLWSLGVVAYEALTGEKPFFAETVGALALKIHRDALPMPSQVNAALGAAVDAWFARACAREPENRFASAREMAEALAVAVTGEGISSRLQVDRLPAPRGLEGAATRGISPVASTQSPVTDARSETGAGVGLMATDRLPMTPRGRWVLLGGIALAAVGVGFVVPRMMGGEPARVAPALPSGVASAPAAVLERAAGAPAMSSAALSPAPSPASAAASPQSAASPPSPSTASRAAPSLPGAGAVGPRTPRPRASSSPLPTASGSAAAPPALAKPPPGSDDDIK